MHLLVLGGNSYIGYAIAREFARKHEANITLASRDMDALEKKAQDLAVRYDVKAAAEYFDALDYESHRSFYASLDPKPDGVVLAFGYTGDQEEAQQSFEEAARSIAINYVGAVSILEIIAEDMEEREEGFIIAISSVAGERGRKSNYIYGSAKAGLSTYLSGLRHRLHESNVHVLTIKPGFVRTKMTEGMDLPEPLVMEPDQVARKTLRAFERKQAETYLTWYWWSIIRVIKNIPNRIFNKLDL